MTSPAIPFPHLSAYLSNIVDGRPIREIARKSGHDPSTILRRIRQCEEAREHPEWDDLIGRIEAYRKNSTDENVREINLGQVFHALEISPEQVAQEFFENQTLLLNRDAIILAGDQAKSAILINGAVRASLSRQAFLAGLFLQWLIPWDRDATGQRVRKFYVSQAFDQRPKLELNQSPPVHTRRSKAPRYSPPNSPLETLARRKNFYVSPAHLQAARQFREIYECRDGSAKGVFDQIGQVVPPRLLNVLIEACGRHTEFGKIERDMQLPARSAKALIIIGLEALTHAGYVK